ncbi:hypothetical protein [Allokutzneria albata]|uniref:Uncharacterized protein n=1 Tax=Allokutzneria albata TaxID=211114 RepID=A0A1G9SBT0_ALLAB|nr:hypothetical protein [Allokutzneria albata]SDM32831.1 hypothetical protein SAMN04489726_1046 [Allokutzneria albata]
MAAQQPEGFALDQDTTEKFWAMLEEDGVTRAGFVMHMGMNAE